MSKFFTMYMCFIVLLEIFSRFKITCFSSNFRFSFFALLFEDAYYQTMISIPLTIGDPFFPDTLGLLQLSIQVNIVNQGEVLLYYMYSKFN